MEQGRESRSPWNTRPLGMVARSTAVVLVLVGVAAIVVTGRVVFFTAFFAALVAAFLSIPVGLLQKLKLPRLVATILSALLILGILAGLGAIAWPTLREQLVIVQQRLPDALVEVVSWVQRQFVIIAGEIGDPDQEGLEDLRDQLMEQLGSLVAGALPVLNTLAGAVTGFFVAVFAGFYLTIEAHRFAHHSMRLVPPASRDRTRGALEEAAATLRRWMLGIFINMVSVGIMVSVVLAILGVPAPLALGMIAGLFEFVPVVGPILAAVPAVLLALIVSPEMAIWVVIAFVAIQQVESNVLTPLVMKGVVRLPPALTILFQSLMAVLFGFLGLFLAVPLLVVVLVLVRRLYVEPMEQR